MLVEPGLVSYIAAMRPVRVVPAGFKQVNLKANADRVPVVLAIKTWPKESLLKQLNKVKGAELEGFVSQKAGWEG